MAKENYKKGKFYTLPILETKNEGKASYYIVEANGKPYAIRMFDFQKGEVQYEELSCMVKDVHGDNIVFVQNSAKMFAHMFTPGISYPFIVNHEVYAPLDEYRYYDIHDSHGIPFKLKCERSTLLIPGQKIKCRVSRPTENRLVVTLDTTKEVNTQQTVTIGFLLNAVGAKESEQRYLMNVFTHSPLFAEAYENYKAGTTSWIVNAIRCLGDDMAGWSCLKTEHRVRLLQLFRSVCLFLLEESDYLKQFSVVERETMQEQISAQVSAADIYIESLRLNESGMGAKEIDSILTKMHHSGYISQPERRMQLLISLFSLSPELMEEKIETILDVL